MKPVKKRGIEEANRLLVTALLNAETFPLNIAAWVFVKQPAIQLMLNEASNHLDSVNYTEWDKFPAEIKAWSACHLQRVEDERIWLAPKRESQKKPQRPQPNILLRTMINGIRSLLKSIQTLILPIIILLY